MTKSKKMPSASDRSKLAYGTLIFSGLAITILAVVAILRSPADNTMTVFNIVLPVMASWVGTILAFYFGRENAEMANQQVREIVQRLTPEQREETSVSSIMRALQNTGYFQIPKGKGDQDIILSEIRSKFSGSISRLPIIDADNKPKYLIHESSVDKYLVSGGKQEDTLAKFIKTERKAGIGFGLGQGFVVVSEQFTLAVAKQKLDESPSCQDIFVTKEGSAGEPLTGWISNIRLAKYLDT